MISRFYCGILHAATNISRRLVNFEGDDRQAYFESMSSTPLPEHFSEDDILVVIGKNRKIFDSQQEYQHMTKIVEGLESGNPVTIPLVQLRHRYALSCGLLIKLRTGMMQVIRRSRITIPTDESGYQQHFFDLVNYYCSELSVLEEFWCRNNLFVAATELCFKAVNISPGLQKELHAMRLQPLTTDMKVVFEPAFLRKVAAYHAEVARPGGTFEDPVEGLNIQQPPLHKNEMLSEQQQDQHQHQQLLIDREHRATEFAPRIEKQTELDDVDAERNRMFQLAELACR